MYPPCRMQIIPIVCHRSWPLVVLLLSLLWLRRKIQQNYPRVHNEATTKKATAQPTVDDDRLWELSACDMVDKFVAFLYIMY